MVLYRHKGEYMCKGTMYSLVHVGVALLIIILCPAWGSCASSPHYLAAALPPHDE